MTVLLVNPTIANATTSNTSVIRGEYINNTGSSLDKEIRYKTNVPADGRSINWYTLCSQHLKQKNTNKTESNPNYKG